MVVDSGKISQGKDLQNMAVSATVVKQTRGPKIITLKHRRRKNSRRVKGHKQDLTLLKVVGIGDPKKLVIICKSKAVCKMSFFAINHVLKSLIDGFRSWECRN